MHSPSPHRCRLIWARTVRPLALAIRLWRTIQDCSQQLLPEALSLLLPLNRSAAPLPILSVRADYAVGIGAHLCEPDCSRPAAIDLSRGLCLLAGLLFGHCRLPLDPHRASRDACTATSPALGPSGAATREGRRRGQQCFLCRESRAQYEARQR